MNRRSIYCCNCGCDVEARLTDGGEIYPHRKDLKKLPFWKCDTCDQFVGCHHKTKDRTRPLGVIPSPEVKALRRKIHSKLDPLWKEYGFNRKKIYAELSEVIGREYHTADLRNADECEMVLSELYEMRPAC